MYQRGCGDELDARRQRLAQCFDADMVIGLEPELMDTGATGATAALSGEGARPPTACAMLGRDSVMAEAGANGLVDEECVEYHVNGVVRVAQRLGMLSETRPRQLTRRNVVSTARLLDC